MHPHTPSPPEPWFPPHPTVRWWLLGCELQQHVDDPTDPHTMLLALGVYTELHGPQDVPPPPARHPQTGTRLDLIGGWNDEPTDDQQSAAIERTFEVARGRQPFLQRTWTDE